MTTWIGFLHRCQVCVGGLDFSLFEIEHSVLRSMSSAPSKFGWFLQQASKVLRAGDPRGPMCLEEAAPEVSFGISYPIRAGCPPLRVYRAEAVKPQLLLSCAHYLVSGGLQIEGSPKRKAVLPPLFRHYHRDFGASSSELLEFAQSVLEAMPGALEASARALGGRVSSADAALAAEAPRLAIQLESLRESVESSPPPEGGTSPVGSFAGASVSYCDFDWRLDLRSGHCPVCPELEEVLEQGVWRTCGTGGLSSFSAGGQKGGPQPSERQLYLQHGVPEGVDQGQLAQLKLLYRVLQTGVRLNRKSSVPFRMIQFLAAIETQGFKSPVLTEQAVRGEIDSGRAILNQKASSQDKEVVLAMPQQISELAHATSSLVSRVALAFRVVPPPTVIRDVTQHAIGALLFKTRLKPRYLGATSEVTAVNAIAANHIPFWQTAAARAPTGPPPMLPIQPMPGPASPPPVMQQTLPPAPPRPKPQTPGGSSPPVQTLSFSQVFAKLRSSVLTLMLTATGSLMLLVMHYYPLGLALLGFTAALLYEKLTSMGKMFVSVAAALGSGVASAVIDAQWNMHPHDGAAQTQPSPFEPHFEAEFEGEAAEPPELQQNLLAFAAGTAQLGPVSHTFAVQTGWSPGATAFSPPMPGATAAAAAAGAKPGFFQEELEKLASNERWTALPSSYKNEYVKAHGPPGLGWALTHDDMLEGLFRQLSAGREFHLTGDAAAASRIIAFRSANESVLPSWLQNEIRGWSNQIHKQELRARGPKRPAGDGAPYPKGKAKAKPLGKRTPDAADGTVQKSPAPQFKTGFLEETELGSGDLVQSVRAAIPANIFAAQLVTKGSGSLGCDQSKVQETAGAWIALIRNSGFIVRDEPVVAELEKYIGYSSQVTPARWKLPVKTLVRLDYAVNFLVKQQWVYTATIQSVLGVLVWAFLLKRPSLSIFFKMYGWVRSTEYEQWGWMTAGLRAELLAARRVLPLCYADCHRLVLPFVMAQDAAGEGEGGLGGWGLGVAAPPPSEIVALALQMERVVYVFLPKPPSLPPSPRPVPTQGFAPPVPPPAVRQSPHDQRPAPGGSTRLYPAGANQPPVSVRPTLPPPPPLPPAPAWSPGAGRAGYPFAPPHPHPPVLSNYRHSDHIDQFGFGSSSTAGTPGSSSGGAPVAKAEPSAAASLAPEGIAALAEAAATSLSLEGINALAAAMDVVKDDLSPAHLAEFTKDKIEALARKFPAGPFKASAYAGQPALAGAGPPISHVARPGQSGQDISQVKLVDCLHGGAGNWPAFGFADVGAAMLQRQQDEATQQLLSQQAGGAFAPLQAQPAPPPPPPVYDGSVAAYQAQQDVATRRLLGDDAADKARAQSREVRKADKAEAEVTCFRLVLNGEIESAEMGAGNHGPLMCVFSVQHGADWTILSGAPNGITQLAVSTVPMSSSVSSWRGGGGLREAVWSFPLGLVFKSTSPFGWPRIAITVYGTDLCNRRVVKGYGSVHIPCQPGRHTRTIRLYCPLSSSPLTRLLGALFGNPAQFVDPRMITGTEGREVIRVQSGGKVRVHFEVLLKDTEVFSYAFS
ncbi:unnamed protein product [Polarella glacialis]|uniref:B9 domain-containing protein 1 n=2 Tax=Polarella glacialis TaxID=89957 RepID=A0A813EPT8_POLGL|nr:unnamed protein product [Polarella glacialis]